MSLNVREHCGEKSRKMYCTGFPPSICSTGRPNVQLRTVPVVANDADLQDIG